MNEKFICCVAFMIKQLHGLVRVITPFVNLLARLWIAQVFFMAGLTKIQNWQSTLFLFHTQYTVPLLPPEFAAYLGTTFELVLPILLILGLGGRILVFLIFVYNLLCVLSYHFLWTVQGEIGLDQHITWGLILLLLTCYGMGKFSLDYVIHKRWSHYLL
jgi:putative oxidoreductase